MQINIPIQHGFTPKSRQAKIPPCENSNDYKAPSPETRREKSLVCSDHKIESYSSKGKYLFRKKERNALLE